MSSPWEPYDPWRAWQGDLTPAEEERFRAGLDAATASGTVAVMSPIRDVVGYCPMGCGQRLHLMPGGMIKCLASGCPDPGSVTKILSDPEAEHVVEVTDDGWTLKHPLRERLGGDLFACRAGEMMHRINETGTLPLGRWRVPFDADGVPVFRRAEPPE